MADSEYLDKNDREYKNKDITVYWKPKKCIHATTCYKELIDVFNPRKRPWVNMQGASTEEIIRVVKMCPTQALSFIFNNPELKDKESQQAISENEIRIMEDGPIIIKGNFTIYDTEGTALRKMKMASLCRCGASNNLPYCNGTHRKTGFTGK